LPDALRDISSGLEWRKWAREFTEVDCVDDETVRNAVGKLLFYARDELRTLSGEYIERGNRIKAVETERDDLRKQLELAEQNRIGQLTIATERHGRVRALNFELNTIQSRLTETENALQSTTNTLLSVTNERDDLAAQINTTRNQLSALSSWLGFGLGGENESLTSMVGRVKEGMEHHFGVMTTMRDTAQNERDTLRAKLDDLERWRQVTSGEGELPPIGVDVIYRYDDRPRLFLGAPSDDRTYQWRFASSGEASNG
jgi:chromosome segregation ATPase